MTTYKNAVKARKNSTASCDRHDGQQWMQVGTVDQKYPGQQMGTTDTGEGFEERRLNLAERVWADMKDSDSRMRHTGRY